MLGWGGNHNHNRNKVFESSIIIGIFIVIVEININQLAQTKVHPLECWRAKQFWIWQWWALLRNMIIVTNFTFVILIFYHHIFSQARRSIASRCGIGTELDSHGTTHRAHLRHSLSARHSLCICLSLCLCICLGLCLCICLFAFWYHTPCSFKTFFICQA